MRKFFSLLLWGAGFGAGVIALLAMIANEQGDKTTNITIAVISVICFLISGIARRIFHIKKEVIENIGAATAIGRRINCARFYWSILMYSAVAFFVYTLLDFEGDILEIVKLIITLAAWYFFFLLVRYTCPRCGRGLTHDEDSYDDTVELTVHDDYIERQQGYTGYWHCPRCGKRVRIRGKRNLGNINFR